MEYMTIETIQPGMSTKYKNMDLGVTKDSNDKPWHNFTKAKHVYAKDKINKKCAEKEVFYKPYDITN